LFETMETASSKSLVRKYQTLIAEGLRWYYTLLTTTGDDDGEEVSFTGFKLRVMGLDKEEMDKLNRTFYSLRRIKTTISATQAA